MGFARRNFLVPVPDVKDFDELNDLLGMRSIAHGGRRIQGREDQRTIDERHDQERERLLGIPDEAFENTKTLTVRVSRYQTVQVERNRYSVPTAYVGRHLCAHVDCDRVSLYANRKKVAEHARAFGNCKWQIDPLHYLELIHRRIGSFEVARPIRQWRPHWPAHYERMLGILRHRQGDSDGTREFVGMLQLHQSYPYARVEGAVAEALECQTYNLDSVKHILVRQDHPEIVFSPLYSGLMPGVTDLTVAAIDVGRYDLLVAGGAQ